MNTMTIRTMWDRAPTDAEIGYSKGQVAFENAKFDYECDVKEAFANIGKVSINTIALPYITGAGKKGIYPMREIIFDYLGNDAASEAFVAMLENSQDPYVLALKNSLENTWLYHQADDVAEFESRGCDD